MLNDKSRPGLSHLPPRRKWAAFHAGQVIRLPGTEVRGGWGAGWYDWLPWRIESFDRHGNATVRSLSDGTVKPITRRQLEFFDEINPGHITRSSTPPRHRHHIPYRYVPSRPAEYHQGRRLKQRVAVPHRIRYV